MRRKLRRQFCISDGGIDDAVVDEGFRYWQKVYKLRLYKLQREQIVPCSRKKQMRKRLPDQKCRNQAQKNLPLSLE